MPTKRALETKEALKKLGVPIFLNIADGELGYKSQHTYLIKTIHDINPDLIITHYDKDYHSDHRNLSKIVYQVSSHYIPIIYCDTMMG